MRRCDDVAMRRSDQLLLPSFLEQMPFVGGIDFCRWWSATQMPLRAGFGGALSPPLLVRRFVGCLQRPVGC